MKLFSLIQIPARVISGIAVKVAFVSAVLALAQGVTTTDLVAQVEEKKIDRATIKSAIDRGANWLIDHQRPDGSWGSQMGDPGITGMVLKSLADTPRAYREEDGPFISSAVKSNLFIHVSF